MVRNKEAESIWKAFTVDCVEEEKRSERRWAVEQWSS